MADELLVKNLVRRLTDSLHAAEDNDGGLKDFDDFREVACRETEQALIELSASMLNVIAKYISQSLVELVNKWLSPMTSEEAQQRAIRCTESMLILLTKCLKYQWDNIREKYRNMEGLNEIEQIRLKEKEESLCPPPLDDNVASDLVRLLYKILHATILIREQEPYKSLLNTAGLTLFSLSSTNAEAVYGQGNFFTDLNDELQLQISFFMMENLNLNSRRLSELLQKLVKISPLIKKDPQRFGLAKSLRKAIWNWIDNFPIEFVSLCKTGQRLPGSPDVLFDLFDSWASGNVKKSNYWPIMMVLLILCPDIMVEATQYSDKKKSKSVASKGKFLDSLRKGMKTPKLADAVAVCYVDICKAATFVSKGLQSGVRHIVPEIEIELQERLFVPQKGDVTLDRAVVVDCLVAFFRLSMRKVQNSLFNDCLRPDYPPVYRLILVECLLRIAREGATLPWNPSISDVYATHSGNLRGLFQDLLKDVLASSNNNASSSESSRGKKSSAAAIDTSSILTETLLKLIMLFNEDPMLALHPSKSSNSSLDDIQSFIVGLCRCVSEFQVEKLSALARQALINVHDSTYIRHWAADEKELIPVLWLVSSKVNSTIATSLISRRDIKPDEILSLVTLIEEILVRRNDFLAYYGGDVRPAPTVEKVRSSRLKDLEIALLIYLTSSKVPIITKCASCIDLLVKEAQIVDIGLDQAPTNTILLNMGVYQQLKERIVSDYTSRKAQQKIIWELLRRVQTHTAGNFGAWEEVYHRWCGNTQILFMLNEAEGQGDFATASGKSKKQLMDFTNVDSSEVLQEWSNCTGFLAALSGICLKVERPLETISKGKVVSEKNFVIVVDSFVDQLLELIVCDNVNIRESVKMVVGSALSPAAYSTLFRHLLAELRKTFGTAGQVQITEQSTLFVDQTISISKLILESETATPEDFSGLTDFEDLLMDVLRYVGQLENSMTSILMRTRLCGLMEAMVKQRNYINVRNEFQMRNKLIGIVIEWTSEFAKGKGQTFDKALQQKIKVLDLACVRAIAALVKGLPLAGDDDEQKSSLFSKYFSFFTRLLTRCKKDPNSTLPELPEVTVQSLSYLVSENIEHGLEYFGAMGYHEDIDTRSAFLNVLTNILKQGAKLESDKSEGQNKYDKLLDLILEPDMKLVIALSTSCQITEADEVAELLVRFFDSHGSIMNLLRTSIDEEVSRTDFVNTLFRRNSHATKLLTHYSKLVGKQYLKETLSVTIRNLLSSNDTFELDASKVQADTPEKAEEIARANMQKVMDVSREILESIFSSVSNCPVAMCDICSYLADAVSKKFPGHEQTAVCGFIFLRFFCPAIVTPEMHGLMQGSPPVHLRRGLVLITKTLQNLANKVTFGHKETYMEPMNKFINANIHRIEPLCELYLKRASDGSTPPPSCFNLSDEEREEDLQRMHYHLHRRFENINKMLRNYTAPEGQKSIYDRFQTVMQQLGNPEEPSKEQKPRQIKPIVPHITKNEMFENFMKKFESNPRSVDPVKQKNIFYEHGRAKDGHPVLYYIGARYTKHFDTELFIFYCMKLLQPFFDNPWHLVIDCTMFASPHELAMAHCSTLDKILPESVRNSLVRVYIVNPNSAVKKYIKRVVSRFLSPSFQKKVVVTTVTGLGEHILAKENGLPASTLSVDNDVKATFHPVMKLGAQFQKRETTLRLSKNLLQMLSSRQYHILGQDTPLLDVIPLTNIYEIDLLEDNDFFVKFTLHGQKSLQFRSPNSKQIVQQLKAMKDRLNVTDKHIRQKSFRPSDVRGTLLNMSLLNLGSNNIFLREAAYNLLAAISSNFNFFVRSEIFEAKGMHIPRNSSHFVTRVSEQLARSHKELTLEFLLEALRGMKKGDTYTRLMCMNYIAPWIPNLALFCHNTVCQDSENKVAKAEEVIKSLISVTIENPVAAPIILQKVWTVVGKVTDLLSIAIESIISFVSMEKVDSNMEASSLQLLQDMTITIATKHARLVAGKLVARAVRLLRQVESNSLTLDPKWPEICLILKLLLPLSFDNLICVQEYLPDIFYVITLVFGNGDQEIRSMVHEMLVNMVHSLYTSLFHDNADGEEGDWMQRIPQLLAEIDQLNFRFYFGIGGKVVPGAQQAVVRTSTKEGKGSKRTSLVHVEAVGTALLEVMNASSVNGDAMGTRAHARLLTLFAMTAFSPNIALQPRAMVTLGILCKSPKVVTEDLFAHVLTELQKALRKPDSNEVTVSTIMCLSNMYEHLPENNRFFKPMFWVAMTLVQINNVNIYQAALTLMEVILKTLEDRGCFEGSGVSQFLLTVRAQLEPDLSQLDTVTGISFTSSFSFALAAHLLKGFRNATTKTPTVRVLSTLVDLTAKRSVGPNMLGYLAVLLPIIGEEMPHLQQLLLPAAEHDPSPHSLLFTEQMIPDSTNAALLFSFLTTMLKTSEFEHERLFIYKCLKEGVIMVPEALPVVYDTLVNHMSHAVQTTQSRLILEEVLAIMKSMFAWDRPMTKDRLDSLYLHKVGFQGLSEADTFIDQKKDDPERVKAAEQRRESITRQAGRLLDRILKG